MKKIIIYSTNDEIISLRLVDYILSNFDKNKYQFDIILSKPNFIRKIKILIVLLLLRSIFTVIKNANNKISISQILSKHPHSKLIKTIEKNYDFGLSVNCVDKIKIEKFKIYNFHLGCLKKQRGSFIFFYKFLFNWNYINLTFHEISNKYDVGNIISYKKILLKENCKATDIFFSYINNLDFLVEAINKIESPLNMFYKDYEKLNKVPNFYNLVKGLFIIYRIKIFNMFK